ncbi:MAG: acyl carrier protein [Candidatus Rokubacteria bacterium]|nr:acyl carrier protein [Candidatus Rokubacteria bacterium]
MQQKAKAIVAGHFKKPLAALDLETRLREDLGADSLDLLELVFELEQELGVSIADAEAAELRTIGDAVRYVERGQS